MSKCPLKKGDTVYENCGCGYKVLEVTPTVIRMRHIADKDIINWSRKQVLVLLATGQMYKPEANPHLLYNQLHVNIAIRKNPRNKRLNKSKVARQINDWLCSWVNDTVTGEFGGGEWGDDVHVNITE